jgi:hypothetical protein
MSLVLLATFVALSLGIDNGLARLPPQGWSTWCTDNSIIPCMNDYCDEKEIRSVADAMAKNGLLALGYNYILLDDCWGGYRDNTTHQIHPDASTADFRRSLIIPSEVSQWNESSSRLFTR